MRHRLPNERRITDQNLAPFYRWKADREEGFSEVRFVYDSEGRLLGVDYRLPEEDGPVNRKRR